jgi:hypothetical protein
MYLEGNLVRAAFSSFENPEEPVRIAKLGNIRTQLYPSKRVKRKNPRLTYNGAQHAVLRIASRHNVQHKKVEKMTPTKQMITFTIHILNNS